MAAGRADWRGRSAPAADRTRRVEMLELLLLLGTGMVVLAVLAAGARLLLGALHLVLGLILLPFQILAGVLGLGLGLLGLPFLLVGFCVAVAGVCVGLALLPLVFVGLAIAGAVWLLRALLRPVRAVR